LANDNWIQDLMYDLSPAMFADYLQLWLLVDGTPFSANDQAKDTIVWTRTANGRYSAKSAYNMQFDGIIESSSPVDIWQSTARSRCKDFIWLMLQRRIWTADRLLLREWMNEYFCPLCRCNLETVAHLFLECPVTRLIWTEFSIWAGLPRLQPENWSDNPLLAVWFRDLSVTSSADMLEHMEGV
jgi:hypothetical protein